MVPPRTALLIAIEKLREAGLGRGVLGKLGNSRAPYSYRKEKECHELIFSWLSWLAVLLMGT